MFRMSIVGRYTRLQSLVAVLHQQRCQWISAAVQIRSVEMRLSTRELILALAVWLQLMVRQ